MEVGHGSSKTLDRVAQLPEADVTPIAEESSDGSRCVVVIHTGLLEGLEAKGAQMVLAYEQAFIILGRQVVLTKAV